MGEINLLKEGLKVAPALVGVLIIVYFFLRYLDKKEVRDLEKDKLIELGFDKRDATIKDISEKAFDIHKESNKVIIENSKILGEIKQVIQLCKNN